MTPYPQRWRMLPTLLAALFMAQFDLYVVNVAGPTLQRELHVGQAALELVVAGYGFTYASGLVTGGRLGDLFGTRRMFLAGTLAFTVASLLCGLAQSPVELVAARLVQGLTGAAMVPQILATITAVFPTGERPRALAWFGVTIGVGSVAGQVFGGMLLQFDLAGLGWRVIFLANVPIGLLAAVAAARLLPRLTPARRAGLDPVGVVGLSGSLALALAPLALGRTEGWPLWTWVSLGASVPVMALTLLWERSLGRRGRQPVLDLALFSDAAFSRGLIVTVALYSGYFGFTFALSLLMQGGIGLTPLQAGLTFMPLGLAFSVASMRAQRVAARIGPRLITIGLSIAVAGYGLLLLVLQLSGGHASALRVVGPMMLVGFGNGLAIPILFGTVLGRIAPGSAGTGSGVLTTAQQFASAAGVTGLGSVFFALVGAGHGTLVYATAMEWVLGLSLVLTLAAALVIRSVARPARTAAEGPVPERAAVPVPAPATTPAE
ncbi:MFS transporter [Streptacidiphilus jiangxiensis]|uniref:Drug resistance transporter, EmrB/QacA subfamily n=1 Tax=Streptacidiphilus jiangxiensis TaxID=235985 RepID=A0A1H7HJR2_STRJI|nr:MFS transporter [Streptacidiphilus jiangxiensis]SEK49180.1 drug resistance transporter, EmrB/QacA subfamily [Streptacidiphilus jiangxiensis]